MKGQLIVISGPSGVGKGTLVDKLIEEREDFILSISCTTRNKRINEVEGLDYFFKTEDEFNEMIMRNQLLEYAQVHGHYYGTPKDFVYENIENDKTVILEIDIQGGLQVKEEFPMTTLIFILPPSEDDIEKRIRKRGTESDDEILVRLETSKNEMKYLKDYDYAVVNDDLYKCVNNIKLIIDANRFRIDNQYIDLYD